MKNQTGGDPSVLPPDKLQVRAVRENSHPVSAARRDYDSLMALIGDSHLVLLGEASHGTHDFYDLRARITEWLIREKGFSAVAVEGDWPDAHRVNRYVQGRGDDTDAVEALDSFKRFPTWMWRNTDVVEFVAWLREHNEQLSTGAAKVGFYGLDLYSLHASARAVLEFLDRVDPAAARRARYRYSCFEHFGEDTQAYGHAAIFGLSKRCEEEVVSQLVEMQKRAAEFASRDGHLYPDAFFIAEQNARLVKNAERYYRSMFESRVWLLEPPRPAYGGNTRRARLPLREIAGQGGGVGSQFAYRRCPSYGDRLIRRMEHRPTCAPKPRE
jgi:erythromycin esterase-like protein